MDPGGEGAGTGYQLPAAIGNDIAARSADDHVDTPTGHPPAPQPACSDQSNVRGLVHPQLQQQQDHGASTEAQSLPPQPTVAPAVAAAEQAASHVKQEQQAQRDQQTAAAPRPGKQAAGSRKRKSAATLSGPPSTSQAQPEAAHSGSHGAWVRRSRLGPADTPTASAGRSKRHASSAGAGNAAAAAAPAAKRRKSAAAADGRASKSPLHHRPSKYADVLHRAVVVPGAIFYVDDPDQLFVGWVNKLEQGRKVPAVEVQFRDDGSKYWFPVADVRRWMQDMCAANTWETFNPGVPRPEGGEHGVAAAPTEEEEKTAAQALQSLSTSLCSSSVRREGGGAQPAQSSGRQQPRGARAKGVAAEAPTSRATDVQQLQRCGSELKRVGALDIMVHAADLNADGSPPNNS